MSTGSRLYPGLVKLEHPVEIIADGVHYVAYMWDTQDPHLPFKFHIPGTTSAGLWTRWRTICSANKVTIVGRYYGEVPEL